MYRAKKVEDFRAVTVADIKNILNIGNCYFKKISK